MRREVPLLLVFLAGVVMSVQFFVPSEFSGNVKDFMTDWLIIIGIFALALGIYSLVRVSFARIRHRAENWPYSIITLLGLFGMIAFGFQIPGVKYTPTYESERVVRQMTMLTDSMTLMAENYANQTTAGVVAGEDLASNISRLSDSALVLANYIIAENWILKTSGQEESLRQLASTYEDAITAAADLRRSAADTAAAPLLAGRLQESLAAASATIAALSTLEHRQPFIGGQTSYMFRHFFSHIMIPIQATMFSLLAFFIASAAYRAFRARSVLATVLLMAALVLMLRLIPMGPITTFFSDLSSWILLTPNLAAKRAILIGVGLGMVATALKVVLGIERNYLGRD